MQLFMNIFILLVLISMINDGLFGSNSTIVEAHPVARIAAAAASRAIRYVRGNNHRKNTRPSNRSKHEKGSARRQADQRRSANLNKRKR